MLVNVNVSDKYNVTMLRRKWCGDTNCWAASRHTTLMCLDKLVECSQFPSGLFLCHFCFYRDTDCYLTLWWFAGGGLDEKMSYSTEPSIICDRVCVPSGWYLIVLPLILASNIGNSWIWLISCPAPTCWLLPLELETNLHKVSELRRNQGMGVLWRRLPENIIFHS